MEEVIESAMSKNMVKISGGYLYFDRGSKKYAQLYVSGNLQVGHIKIYNCKSFSLNWDKFKELRVLFGHSKNNVGIYFNVPVAQRVVVNPMYIVESILNYINFKLYEK